MVPARRTNAPVSAAKRRCSPCWCFGMMSIAGTNWGLRIDNHVEAVLPLGLFLSVLGSIFVGIAGWHGGKLVFDHGIGLMVSNND